MVLGLEPAIIIDKKYFKIPDKTGDFNLISKILPKNDL